MQHATNHERNARVPHLVEQGDVEREAEAVPQADLVRQCVAQLAGGGGGVSEQGLGGAVHEGDGAHDGLLGLGGLGGGEMDTTSFKQPQ